MICKKCKLEKNRFKIYKKHRIRFFDENGKRWDGKLCPSCSLENTNKWFQKHRGYKPKVMRVIGKRYRNKCFKCDRLFMVLLKNKAERSKHEYIYVDKNNNTCGFRICHNCLGERTRLYTHRIGRHKPIDKVTHPRIKKGRKAERLVEKYFNESGYKTTITNGKGPDLIIYPKNEKPFTVEVKSTTKTLNCYRTQEIRPYRKKDNFIAIVLPNKRIYFDTMRHHLSQCAPGGERTISDIVKRYGLT